MTVAQLRDVRAATATVAGKQGARRSDGFIIYNQLGTRDQLNPVAHIAAQAPGMHPQA
jgi:hypothetical protein